MKTRDSNRASLPGEAKSYWMASTPETDYPQFTPGIAVDVIVIGAGIAGLTTAILLKEAGVKVALIEAGQVGSGVSGHTTGKVTSAHGIIYADMTRRLGAERARLYADANQSAVEFVASFSAKKGISCDFHRQNAYNYTLDEALVPIIENETAAAKSLGLPVSFRSEIPVPFGVKGAVCYEGQAYFHPRKYLIALASLIPGNGSYVFEKTRAIDIMEGQPCEVTTEKGILRAERVILATHFPILDTGFLYAKMRPRRSYLMSAHIAGELPEGMYWELMDDSYHTFRPHVTDSGDRLLLFGGESHTTGYGGSTVGRYQRIYDFWRERFEIKSVDYRWSTQDNDPADMVPFIGRLGRSGRLYVATGFLGWGMSNGTVSGMLLRDLIIGKENPWAALFDPNRSNPLISKRHYRQNVRVPRLVPGERLTARPEKKRGELKPGEGALSEKNGEKVAAYRDGNGKLRILSPVCSHLGCQVVWNDAEESWDCPCHGSRFNNDGKVLHAPTVSELPEV